MCSHTISVIALLVTKSKFKDFPVLYFNIGDLLVIMAKCFFLEEPIFTEKPHFTLIRYDNYWATAKRSQHLNATYPNIVGPAFASSGQTIVTFERNIATFLGAAFCTRLATLLQRVATCCELKIELVRIPRRNIVARTWHSRSHSLRSFWSAAGIESSGSNHYERTKEITEFWLFGSLRICI